MAVSPRLSPRRVRRSQRRRPWDPASAGLAAVRVAELVRLTSLRQGYGGAPTAAAALGAPGGPPKLQRRRKANPTTGLRSSFDEKERRRRRRPPRRREEQARPRETATLLPLR